MIEKDCCLREDGVGGGFGIITSCVIELRGINNNNVSEMSDNRCSNETDTGSDDNKWLICKGSDEGTTGGGDDWEMTGDNNSEWTIDCGDGGGTTGGGDVVEIADGGN